jgi:hypothetical protein
MEWLIYFLLLFGGIDTGLKENDWVCWARPVTAKFESSIAWHKNRGQAELDALEKCIRHYKKRCVIDGCTQYKKKRSTRCVETVTYPRRVL